MWNKEILFQFFNKLSATIPLKKLVELTGQKIILPFYHTVSDHYLPHISNLYAVKKIPDFKNDLHYLCKYYKPITLSELYDIIDHDKEVKHPVFHLTFDDGLSQIYTTIAPILKEAGIPATIFVNSDFVDNKNLFFRYKCSLLIENINENNIPSGSLEKISSIMDLKGNNKDNICHQLLNINYPKKEKLDTIAAILDYHFFKFLERETPYLTSIQIEKLVKDGFTIGAHSKDHPLFKDISSEDQKIQISESINFVTKRFKIRDKYFSFPFNDASVPKDLFQWLFDQEQCKLSFGVSGLKKEAFKYHLHRIPMERSLSTAEQIIKNQYIYYLFKAILGKNRINRI